MSDRSSIPPTLSSLSVTPSSLSLLVQLVAWDNRDDQSWLDSVPFRGQAQGTLFDRSGNPKLAYYEVQARFQRFVDGLPEPCATSDGVDKCVLQGYE
jgi:hypothetical protein